MRRFTSALLLVLISAPAALCAQDSAKDDKPVLEGPLAEMAKEYQASFVKYRKDMLAAKTPDERAPIQEQFDALKQKTATAALEHIQTHPDDASNGLGLQFVIRVAGRSSPITVQAFELLAREHASDAGMGQYCRSLISFVHLPAAEAFLRAVIERHPDKTDRGLSLFGLARYLQFRVLRIEQMRLNLTDDESEQAQSYAKTFGPENVERLLAMDVPVLEKEAEAALERVLAEHAELDIDDAKGRTLQEVAGGMLYALRNLKVGQTAPDIVGTDKDGTEFKLSDSRGKVVVLTFTGNWCPPCRAMYPHDRELIERLKDKPFEFLSVNTDSKKEVLEASIEKGTVTWRCWWDGGTGGPLSTKWGVSVFPTIFVLDAEGVIRAKHVRGELLDKTVDKLLGQM